MLNLMVLFAIPFIAAFILFLCSGLRAHTLKTLSFIFSLIPLVLLLIGHANWIGQEVNLNWVPNLSIHFHLRVDALSLVFLYLTTIIIPISLLAVNTENSIFFALVLLLEGLLIGLFTTNDLIFFVIFYEAILLPLYFIINLWGGAQKQEASLKFIIYMIAGSSLMVAAILFFYLSYETFSLSALSSVENAPYAKWLCLIFLLAFAVKTPLFPFHAWLPDAYYQASTSGTILLSALLSKAGIYGIVRIVLQLFPTVMQEFSPVLLALSITGVFYGGLSAWVQTDFKRLIAYSSFSHVNFILAGLFVWSAPAQSGGILQAFNHGITITGLFLLTGFLEERIGTTKIHLSGLAKFLPILCWLTLFFALSSVALPGMNNFVGEIMILLGLFKHNMWVAAILTLSVILSVIYMLHWIQKLYFEEPVKFQNNWIDIQPKEIAITLPLLALVLFVGIYPAPLLDLVIAATKHFGM